MAGGHGQTQRRQPDDTLRPGVRQLQAHDRPGLVLQVRRPRRASGRGPRTAVEDASCGPPSSSTAQRHGRPVPPSPGASLAPLQPGARAAPGWRTGRAPTDGGQSQRRSACPRRRARPSARRRDRSGRTVAASHEGAPPARAGPGAPGAARGGAAPSSPGRCPRATAGSRGSRRGSPARRPEVSPRRRAVGAAGRSGSAGAQRPRARGPGLETVRVARGVERAGAAASGRPWAQARRRPAGPRAGPPAALERRIGGEEGEVHLVPAARPPGTTRAGRRRWAAPVRRRRTECQRADERGDGERAIKARAMEVNRLSAV